MANAPIDVLEVDEKAGEALVIDKSTRIKAVVLEPIYGQPEALYHTSVMIAAQNFGRNELRFTLPERRTLIDSARDRLAHRAMSGYPNAEAMIFIDCDHLLPMGNAKLTRQVVKTTLPDRLLDVNFFARMLSHSLDLGIIGATYVDRINGTDVQCQKGCGTHRDPAFNEAMMAGKFRGLLPMEWVGTGGMRIPRWVHLKMLAAIDRWPECKQRTFGERAGLFTRARHTGGEDVGYCLRARELEIPVYLDTECRLLHKGERWM